jgi:hypothetical protein
VRRALRWSLWTVAGAGMVAVLCVAAVLVALTLGPLAVDAAR